MIIGITGNSGVGKTEIAKILSKKINAKIIDADKIVKTISVPKNEYYNKIVEIFGNEILKENGYLNRTKIASIIYKNNDIRDKLNNITYIYVVKEIENRIKKINGENIIIDAPLLFESGLNKLCNFTIAILSDYDKKLERIITRDNIDRKIAINRLNIQQNDEYYNERADYIIVNNKSIESINMEEICTKIGKT